MEEREKQEGRAARGTGQARILRPAVVLMLMFATHAGGVGSEGGEGERLCECLDGTGWRGRPFPRGGARAAFFFVWAELGRRSYLQKRRGVRRMKPAIVDKGLVPGGVSRKRW